MSHDEVVHGKKSIRPHAGRRMAEIREPARLLTAGCGHSRARNYCSWVTNSPRAASGTTTLASTGICWKGRRQPAPRCPAYWCRDPQRLDRHHKAMHELDFETVRLSTAGGG
ncbi:hypothetical protein ACVXHB_06990 [Escherichia coli]